MSYAKVRNAIGLSSVARSSRGNKNSKKRIILNANPAAQSRTSQPLRPNRFAPFGSRSEGTLQVMRRPGVPPSLSKVWRDCSTPRDRLRRLPDLASPGPPRSVMIAEAFVLAVVCGLPALERLWAAACTRTSEYTMFVAGCFLSQLFGYFLGVLPYAMVDAVRPVAFTRRKIQPGKYLSRADAARTVAALAGLFVAVMLPMIAAGGGYLGLVGISRDGPLPGRGSLLVQLGFFLVVEDYLNYWLHRWLHTPWLYKKVHAVHHEFTAPFALMATYAHPVEVVVLAIPTFAGPALVAPHMFTVFVWQLLRNYEAIDIHSGYEMPWSAKSIFAGYAGAEHHDYHHYMHSGNFASVFVWCDQLYGTDLGYEMYNAKKLR
jgi:plant 4,4-dimethylsterol C-4alpha-methyl-monooxygenase